jgi:hypothetical protein
VPRFWRDEVAVSEAAVLDRVTLVGHRQAADANQVNAKAWTRLSKVAPCGGATCDLESNYRA